MRGAFGGKYSNAFNILLKMLTPKGLRVFLLKTASKQPLLKTSQIVQDWNQSWYFKL
jgi:hypothetical protein